ncbi:MAG TPA: hypothetical protein VN963_02160 [bacterium]|nr:hypothetical protein [bacterium]
MNVSSKPHLTYRETTDRLARRTLFGFIITFLVARADVFLIMAQMIPNGYLFLGQTHVHHLNYGIFLLSAVAAYSIFWRPVGLKAEIEAVIYGIAMALTFDEFGMWLHLGGSYWQRASVDAVIVIAAVIALVAFGRSIKRFESRHLWAFIALFLALARFAFALLEAGNTLGNMVGPKLQFLEETSSL